MIQEKTKYYSYLEQVIFFNYSEIYTWGICEDKIESILK